ncbi:MAG: hypothetical protein V1912_11285 [bacterium]
MSIITLQQSWRELGRIRMGVQVKTRSGKMAPSKLDTFRLTSDSKELLDHVAAEYGGKVEPWTDGREAWQIVTEAVALDIVVPPRNSFERWYELWTAGGCQRRCTGEREVLSDQPCMCPSDPSERAELAAKGEACKPSVYLNVMLPRIPDLGVWRLVSHGYYAATELAGTAELLAALAANGRLISARLRLDQRVVKRPGKPPNHFAVPVIELPDTRLADMIGAAVEIPSLPAFNRREMVERPALPPGPELPSETAFTRPDAPMGNPPAFGGALQIEDEDARYEQEQADEDASSLRGDERSVAPSAGKPPSDFGEQIIATGGLPRDLAERIEAVGKPEMSRWNFDRWRRDAKVDDSEITAAHEAVCPTVTKAKMSDSDWAAMKAHIEGRR